MTNFNDMHNLEGIFANVVSRVRLISANGVLKTGATYFFDYDGIHYNADFGFFADDNPKPYEKLVTLWNVNEPGMPIHRLEE